MHFIKALSSFVSSVSRDVDDLVFSLLDKILPVPLADDIISLVRPFIVVRMRKHKKSTLRTLSFRKKCYQSIVFREGVRAGTLHRADSSQDYINQIAPPRPPPSPVTRVHLAAAFERKLFGNRKLHRPGPKTTVKKNGKRRSSGGLCLLPFVSPIRRVPSNSQWAEDSMSAARRQMLKTLEMKSCLKVAGEPSRPKKVRFITDEDGSPVASEYVFKTWEVAPEILP